jgi:hypothetical protein
MAFLAFSSHYLFRKSRRPKSRSRHSRKITDRIIAAADTFTILSKEKNKSALASLKSMRRNSSNLGEKARKMFADLCFWKNRDSYL